jgi:uncharacterized protein YciI
MEFVIYAMDRQDGGEARRKARTAHIKYIVENPDHFVYGGPLLDDDGKPRGSLMVMRFEDRPALDRHLAQDPYFQSGVFESVTIWASRQVIPELQPGQLKAELDKQIAADAATR